MNYRQSSDYRLEKLEDEIIWENHRKSLIKDRLQEKIVNKSKERRTILNWEWLKVSMSLLFVGLLSIVLVTNVGNKKIDFQESNHEGSVSYQWHNIELKPVLPPQDINWAEFESYPMTINFNKNFDLEESQKLASFKIMRPTLDLNMPLEVSRGTVQYPSSLPMKTFRGPITYYDIWHQGDKWVYAIQSSNEEATQLLNQKEMTFSWKIRSNDQVIPLKDKDGVAILSDEGEDGKRIRMYVKNKHEQVIYIELRGTINEDELIKLAQSYNEK